MDFRDARDLAIEMGADYGTLTPAFDRTSPLATCWVDRMASVQRASDRLNDGRVSFTDFYAAVSEANRYAQQNGGK